MASHACLPAHPLQPPTAASCLYLLLCTISSAICYCHLLQLSVQQHEWHITLGGGGGQSAEVLQNSAADFAHLKRPLPHVVTHAPRQRSHDSPQTCLTLVGLFRAMFSSGVCLVSIALFVAQPLGMGSISRHTKRQGLCHPPAWGMQGGHPGGVWGHEVQGIGFRGHGANGCRDQRAWSVGRVQGAWSVG